MHKVAPEHALGSVCQDSLCSVEGCGVKNHGEIAQLALKKLWLKRDRGTKFRNWAVGGTTPSTHCLLSQCRSKVPGQCDGALIWVYNKDKFVCLNENHTKCTWFIWRSEEVTAEAWKAWFMCWMVMAGLILRTSRVSQELQSKDLIQKEIAMKRGVLQRRCDADCCQAGLHMLWRMQRKTARLRRWWSFFSCSFVCVEMLC